MYKHILVPVDGTKLSDKAVKEAAGLAAAVGAKLTLFHVAPAYTGAYYAESAVMMAQYDSATFAAESAKSAQKVLDRSARQSKMTVVTKHATSDLPYDAIVKQAAKDKCDLIVMASHGRRGVAGFLLGSETQKVLTHSKVPVLVVR